MTLSLNSTISKAFSKSMFPLLSTLNRTGHLLLLHSKSLKTNFHQLCQTNFQGKKNFSFFMNGKLLRFGLSFGPELSSFRGNFCPANWELSRRGKVRIFLCVFLVVRGKFKKLTFPQTKFPIKKIRES